MEMTDTLPVLLQTVRAAGQAVIQLSETERAVRLKTPTELVSAADLLVNDLLKTKLSEHFPGIAWLSEESVDDAKRLQQSAVWIVDPIDGTREYVKGIQEYAISVALVALGQPIVAAVFNPVTNQLFHAVAQQGAWLNDRRIHCREKHDDEPLRVLASRSEYERGEWDCFQALANIQPVGSIAYKLGLVAAGEAHATFSLGPKNEWDIAAGVLLVREAGGFVSDQHRQPFWFNQQDLRVNGIIACAKTAVEQVFALTGR